MGLSKLLKILCQAHQENMFTAAALVIIQDGHLVLEEYVGSTGFSNERPVGSETLFDLASLTKILATTSCWMKIVENSPDSLDQTLDYWMPDIPSDKSQITPRLLLAHSSGLHAWRPYYLFERGKDQFRFVLERIINEPLDYPTGTGSLYSDSGFVLLAYLLEKQTGKRLDELSRDMFFEPLSLSDKLLFNPAGRSLDIAQTRRGDDPELVNDLNARALGGVSGHAGLFGTARGVASACAEFLTSLKHAGGFFNQNTIRLFVTPCNYIEESSRALGFDTKSGEGSSCGSLFSDSSFGHTGFTGTSFWIDPQRNIVAVFLTNRVIMGEPDLRIKILRPKLHDEIVKFIS